MNPATLANELQAAQRRIEQLEAVIALMQTAPEPVTGNVVRECDECGAPFTTRKRNGWAATACDSCSKPAT